MEDWVEQEYLRYGRQNTWRVAALPWDVLRERWPLLKTGLYGSEVVSLWGYCFQTGGLAYDIYINYMWSMLQQYYFCLNVHVSSSCFITHLHVFSIRPLCFLHVPWCHTFNLHYTCAYHVYTIRNPCPLISFLTLTPSRLFLILPDRSSLCHMTSRSHAYLLSLCPL